MRNTIILLFSLLTYISSAQVHFKTGNVQLDSDLNSINANANVDFGAFKAELCISYNVSERKIEYMHATLNMAPGEIYLVLEISKISKTSIDSILDLYRMHKSKGWGYIAKKAGIKPGSAEFHQLKNNVSNKKNKGAGNSNAKSYGKGKGKNKKK